jgi:hypothetical protein
LHDAKMFSVRSSSFWSWFKTTQLGKHKIQTAAVAAYRVTLLCNNNLSLKGTVA